MNIVVLICRITNDVEIRETASGKQVANLRVVRNYKGKPSYFNVEAWGSQADRAKDAGKGALIALDGYLAQDSWKPEGAEFAVDTVKVVATSLSMMRRSLRAAGELDEPSGDEIPE